MKKLLPLLITLFTVLNINAQTVFSPDILTEPSITNPLGLETVDNNAECVTLFAGDLKEFNAYNEYLVNAKSTVTNDKIRVPIVFHVLYRNITYQSGTVVEDGKVSKYQLWSAVDDMNQAFRAQYGSRNKDSFDTNIEFYLANTDEEGNSFTGILYHDMDTVPWLSESDRQQFSDNGVYLSGISDLDYKTHTALDQEKYVNIWIVPEIDNNGGGGGIQGFAYLPGGNLNFYGIVQLDNATGTPKNIGYYDLDNSGDLDFEETSLRFLKSYTSDNGTLNHEMGHHFALFHTFQSTNDCIETDCEWQGDRICDTNPTELATSCNYDGCPDPPNKNYMGYTSCPLEFTEGQNVRMRSAIFDSFNDNFENAWKPHMTDVEVTLINKNKFRCGNEDYTLKIRNIGDSLLTNLKIAYGNININDTIDWVGNLGPSTYRFITIPALSEPINTTWVKVLEINTLPVSKTPTPYPTPIGSNTLTVDVVTDILGGQNNWVFESLGQGDTLASRDDYPNFTVGELYSDTVCFNGPGPFLFTFNDINGNGFAQDEATAVLYFNNGFCSEIPEDFTDVWEVTTCEFQLIEEFVEDDLQPDIEKTIEGYYDFMGRKLKYEPIGINYIIRYTDGSFEKRLKGNF